MEKCLPFKSFTGALFFLALLFIMYDPPEIHSQCVDVSSSPCYVNISDIPYEMFEGTKYSTRTEKYYDSIRNELVFVDTCNQEWNKNSSKLLHKYFTFYLKTKYFKTDLKEGEIITINNVKNEYQELKDIFNEFESKFCPFKFQIITSDVFFVKLILEKHAFEKEVDDFWINKDTNHKYYQYYSGILILDPSTTSIQNETTHKLKILVKDNSLDIKNYEELFNEEVIIYNFLGSKQIKTVINSSEVNIDISSLSRGIYFVKINNKIYKFMKE